MVSAFHRWPHGRYMGQTPLLRLSLPLALTGGVTTDHPRSRDGLGIRHLCVRPCPGSHRAELFPTTLRSSANTAASNIALAGSAFGLIIGIYTIDSFGLTNTMLTLGIGVLVAAGVTLLLPEMRGQDLRAISADGR